MFLKEVAEILGAKNVIFSLQTVSLVNIHKDVLHVEKVIIYLLVFAGGNGFEIIVYYLNYLPNVF